MSQVDLVLIHPNSRAENYQALSEFAAVEPPVWAAMLAAYVRLKGHTVAIIDAEAERLSPSQVAERVGSLAPLLAAVVCYGHHPSASTQVMPAAHVTVRMVKAIVPRCLTMLLGGHVAALPEQTLKDEFADIVCTGEGPIALDRCLRSLKDAASGFASIDPHGLTAPSGLVEDLDGEMPEPAWNLLPMHLYRAHNWHCLGGIDRSPYVSLYTSLGCPFSCSFCCIQAPFKSGEKVLGMKPEVNSYRRWSPARIGQTLEGLAKRGIRNVKIADEMFVLNRAHVEGVCDEILRRGLSLNLWAYARTDTVKPGMLEKLHAAGFRWLAFGIESGDATVRAGSDKAQNADSINEVIQACRDVGIHVIANYIFGLPGETRETMQATLDLAGDLNTEFANFYTAMAYPGSPLYAEAFANRREDLPTSWSGYSQLARDAKPLRTEALSAKEILAFRDAAFRIYHSSDRYRAMIRSTFGAEGILEVDEMLAGKLERDA